MSFDLIDATDIDHVIVLPKLTDKCKGKRSKNS